jgi:hypothetical protein
LLRRLIELAGYARLGLLGVCIFFRTDYGAGGACLRMLLGLVGRALGSWRQALRFLQVYLVLVDW